MNEALSTQSEGRAKADGGAADRQGRLWSLWVAGAAIFAAVLAFARCDPGQGTPPFFLLLGIASAHCRDPAARADGTVAAGARRARALASRGVRSCSHHHPVPT
jgi:hypothetical protein